MADNSYYNSVINIHLDHDLVQIVLKYFTTEENIKYVSYGISL